MKCALVARDANMVLCEYSTPDCQPALLNKLKKKLKRTQHPLDKFHTKKGDFIAIKTDVIIFACLASNSLREERLPQFLEELKTAFAEFYKMDLGMVHKQNNLKPNVFNVPFKKNFGRLFDKYNTGINMGTIQLANSKINDLKSNLSETLVTQYGSNKETAEFEETSQTLNLNAKLFEKVTHELEKTAEKRNWWMCSKQCMLTFAIGGAILAAIITIISLSV